MGIHLYRRHFLSTKVWEIVWDECGWFGTLPTTKLALEYWRGTFLISGTISLCLLQVVYCYCGFVAMWGASITTTGSSIVSMLKGISSGGSVSYEHTNSRMAFSGVISISIIKHPNVWNKKGWTGYDHDTAQEECLEGTLLHWGGHMCFGGHLPDLGMPVWCEIRTGKCLCRYDCVCWWLGNLRTKLSSTEHWRRFWETTTHTLFDIHILS